MDTITKKRKNSGPSTQHVAANTMRIPRIAFQVIQGFVYIFLWYRGGSSFVLCYLFRLALVRIGPVLLDR